MAKLFFRFFNRVHIFFYRLTSGRFGGRVQGLRVLLLTTKGRKTGIDRTVPLGSFEDGGAYIVIASNAGSDAHPGWFINLRSQPKVRVQIGAKPMEAEARILEGSERERLWGRLVALSPGYTRYEKSTERVIPLIALRPSR
jgi:deazaflavin-dependent oxidoreductase (nitroreductase family)